MGIAGERNRGQQRNGDFILIWIMWETEIKKSYSQRLGEDFYLYKKIY
jgi:hypothetical protein